ncbi:hypothetical protein DC522_28360 [Microvirga sp. KLBC 81]|nr:hypothetical protein DC522_28360 [Microvirga sp. KLBC 81]
MLADPSLCLFEGGECLVPLVEWAEPSFHEPGALKFRLCVAVGKANQNRHQLAIHERKPPLLLIKGRVPN